MGDVHQLIVTHGRDEAARRASATERPLVDIAARMLADESQELGITYSGFCLTALPHKKIPDTEEWNRQGHKVSLLIEPGKIPVDGALRLYGVPYGSRARMILIYLQTRAVIEKSPVIELGKSMNAWLSRMDIPVCGQNYKDVREQAARISACRLTFYWQDDKKDLFKKDSIVSEGIRLAPDNGQGSLWQDTVRLSDTFYNSLCSHPVPILEPAVRAISGKSMSLDIYIWLAYRLHALQRPTNISWQALHSQFGAGFKLVRQFKPEFRRALGYSLAVYPDAKVSEPDDGFGITLFPSPPPIPEKLIGRR